LKIDGFRALAHVQDAEGELISRNGNVFRGFADLANGIGEHLKVEDAVLDGEIACIDAEGRPVFKDLLFRKSTCIFVAFDLLFVNGKDPEHCRLSRESDNSGKCYAESVHGFSTWTMLRMMVGCFSSRS
jgi:ATP-dependent DNA ligase